MNKKNTIYDERIIAKSLKNVSQAYSLTLLALLMVLLYKQFYLQLPFKGYAAEFIIFFASISFLTAKNIMGGVTKYGSKGMMRQCVICGFTVCAINIYLNRGSLGFTEIAVSLLSAVAASALCAFILSRLSASRIKKLEKQYEDSADTND